MSRAERVCTYIDVLLKYIAFRKYPISNVDIWYFFKTLALQDITINSPYTSFLYSIYAIKHIFQTRQNKINIKTKFRVKGIFHMFVIRIKGHRKDIVNNAYPYRYLTPPPPPPILRISSTQWDQGNTDIPETAKAWLYTRKTKASQAFLPPNDWQKIRESNFLRRR